MVMSLSELLAADPSALRHADWVEFQRLARESIRDNDRIHFPCREVELRIVEAGKADARDAARMREVDALVGAGMVDRLASWVVDDNARHDPKYASWAEKSEGHRDRVRSVVGRVLTAFAAALLTDGAVEAFDNGYDNAFAPELDRFRAGIRAAIRAAGMEPVERTQSCPRCDMHAAEAKQLGETLDQVARYIGRMHEADGHADHRASDAEADALRAEVVALRGLLSDALPHVHDVARNYGPREAKDVERRIGDALATVPPAKVADAVKHHDLCNCDTCLAVKAEASGLASDDDIDDAARRGCPLDALTVRAWEGDNADLDMRVGAWLVRRVVAMSAIAKRGGL